MRSRREDDTRRTEEQPLRPLHPYGISKVCLDLLAREYFLDYKIPAVNLRLFNTTGPGKTIFLLAGGAMPPILRVLVVVTMNGAVNVLMDGVALETTIAPGSAGANSTLTVRGKDLTAVMNLIDFRARTSNTSRSSRPSAAMSSTSIRVRSPASASPTGGRRSKWACPSRRST